MDFCFFCFEFAEDDLNSSVFLILEFSKWNREQLNSLLVDSLWQYDWRCLLLAFFVRARRGKERGEPHGMSGTCG